MAFGVHNYTEMADYIGTLAEAAKPADEEFKVSLRTYEPFDASAICRVLGGGGHKAAAGATFAGDIDATVEAILTAVRTVYPAL